MSGDTVVNATERMQSSGMLRRVAVVKTDVSDESTASVIWVTTIDKLGPQHFFVVCVGC
jgi:hypothetical protein